MRPPSMPAPAGASAGAFRRPAKPDRLRRQVPLGDVAKPAASGLLLPSDPLIVRVLPDVPAIDKTFDYLVPDDVRDQVRVGDEVRIDLHGRRVGGWVLELGVEPP